MQPTQAERARVSSNTAHVCAAQALRATLPREAALTTVERSANRRLLGLISRRLELPGTIYRSGRTLKSRTADDDFYSRMEPLLHQFGSRCNCGRRLARTREVGIVFYRCACGFACKEAT